MILLDVLHAILHVLVCNVVPPNVSLRHNSHDNKSHYNIPLSNTVVIDDLMHGVLLTNKLSLKSLSLSLTLVADQVVASPSGTPGWRDQYSADLVFLSPPKLCLQALPILEPVP